MKLFYFLHNFFGSCIQVHFQGLHLGLGLLSLPDGLQMETVWDQDTSRPKLPFSWESTPITGWWFGIVVGCWWFGIGIPINFYFFRGVETTNQIIIYQIWGWVKTAYH